MEKEYTAQIPYPHMNTKPLAAELRQIFKS